MLWGVVRGGAHKTDLKGALEVSSKAVGTRLGRKGLGTLQGAILPRHLWNDQNRGRGREVGEATSELHQDTQGVTSPGRG